MDWHDEITAKLPPHHEEEPPTLREEIIYELRDHLEASFRRELLICVDADLARQRVLENFGNPADIALNLWYEAMKGKLMNNKISLVLTAFVTIFCVCMIGVMWSVMSAQADMNRTQVEAMMAQTQMMMEQFKSNSNQKEESGIASDWAELTVSALPLESSETVTPPKIEIRIISNSIISPGNFGSSISDFIKLQPGESHNFGALPAGQYQFSLTGPAGFGANRQILLGPGREQNYEFEILYELPEQLPLEIQFTTADGQSLRDDDQVLLLFVVDVDPIESKTNQWGRSTDIVVLTIDPNGNVLAMSGGKDTAAIDEVASVKNQTFYCLPGKYALAQICLHRTLQDDYNSVTKYYSAPARYEPPKTSTQGFSIYDQLFYRPHAGTSVEVNSIPGQNNYVGRLPDDKSLTIDLTPVLNLDESNMATRLVEYPWSDVGMQISGFGGGLGTPPDTGGGGSGGGFF
ncbi:hypothetical protein [uncultured Rubinisphaera sp.]|uniref:hypothetical protein n=1 Tax=uncultured Rubinisphaera sp. TaxID=1678686 RepID=UPI0030DAEF9F